MLKLQERYFNAKMAVCMSTRITYEQLADELHKLRILKHISGYQKVDFNRRLALVVKDPDIRDLIVERGIYVNGIHVVFAHHKRRVYTRT